QIKKKAQQIDYGDFAAIRHGGSSGEGAYRIGLSGADKRNNSRYTVKTILTILKVNDAESPANGDVCGGSGCGQFYCRRRVDGADKGRGQLQYSPAGR
ncbi:hypothetical protein ABZE59_011745, partial [Enterobacter cloacae subsp. cloacae]